MEMGFMKSECALVEIADKERQSICQLLCDKRDLVNLIDNLDEDTYDLIHIQSLPGKKCSNIFDFLKGMNDIETGGK